jgi:hypothetical protein
MDNKRTGSEMKRKKVWLYGHTINGSPAMYYEGEQICYATRHRGGNGITKLAASIYQIKKEQAKSDRWRLKKGFDICKHDYGYFRILKEAL